MIVRPAIAKDLSRVVDIVERCGLAAEGVGYTDWSGVLLVAERQGEIVGFIHMLPARPYAVITHIAVVPEHQKGRSGVKLIEGAELVLRSLGCTNWFTYIWEKDTPMRTVATKWGAVESPTVGHLYRRNL